MKSAAGLLLVPFAVYGAVFAFGHQSAPHRQAAPAPDAARSQAPEDGLPAAAAPTAQDGPVPEPEAATARALARATPQWTERLRASRTGLTRAPLPGEEALPDPDGIGPCPVRTLRWRPDAPVVRRAIDADGWPTWWHGDGTVTKRVVVRAMAPDGGILEVPSVTTLHTVPEWALQRPDADRGAAGGDPDRTLAGSAGAPVEDQ